LHVCDVIVDDLEKPVRLFGDVAADILQGFFVEGLGDTAWVDGAHGVVGATLFVTLDRDLHGQTAIEDD